MNSARRRRKRIHSMPEISLTPLIDTALVLLVIFMIATPIMNNSLNIDLPKGQMKEDATESSHAVLIEIDAQERMMVQKERYTLDKLLEELPRMMKSSKEKKVYVRCDEKVKSGTLVSTIDAIKFVSGVEHVVLITENARGKKAAR